MGHHVEMLKKKQTKNLFPDVCEGSFFCEGSLVECCESTMKFRGVQFRGFIECRFRVEGVEGLEGLENTIEHY